MQILPYPANPDSREMANPYLCLTSKPLNPFLLPIKPMQTPKVNQERETVFRGLTDYIEAYFALFSASHRATRHALLPGLEYSYASADLTEDALLHSYGLSTLAPRMRNAMFTFKGSHNTPLGIHQDPEHIRTIRDEVKRMHPVLRNYELDRYRGGFLFEGLETSTNITFELIRNSRIKKPLHAAFVLSNCSPIGLAHIQQHLMYGRYPVLRYCDNCDGERFFDSNSSTGLNISALRELGYGTHIGCPAGKVSSSDVRELLAHQGYTVSAKPVIGKIYDLILEDNEAVVKPLIERLQKRTTEQMAHLA